MKKINEDFKKINSDVIKIFSDLMNNLKFDEEWLNENQDEDEYEIDYWFLEKRLKGVLLDLIIDNDKIIKVKTRKLQNGDYFTFGHSKFELFIIDWIKENLDVWEINELEYDEKLMYRRFEFKRKNDI